MKRSISFLAALTLILTLAACGDGGLDLNPGGGQKDDPKVQYGEIGDTLSTEWFTFSVDTVRCCDQYGGYAAGDGNQLVVAALTLKNTCGSAVEMWEDDFVILWDDPDEDSGIDIPLSAGLDGGQFPDEYTLGNKETKTGELVFEVPADFEEFAIGFQEIYVDEDNPDNEEGIEGNTFFVTFHTGETQ